jgi:hypothetical protein
VNYLQDSFFFDGCLKIHPRTLNVLARLLLHRDEEIRELLCRAGGLKLSDSEITGTNIRIL